ADAGQDLEDAAPRPVEVGAVLEDDVHERHTEHRLAAHRGDVRRADERGDDGKADLILDEIGRAAGPLGEDGHLHVGEVGERVERRAPESDQAEPGGEQGEGDGEGAMPDARLDQPGDHCRSSGGLQRGSASRRRASLERRKVAPIATRSPAASPARTSTKSPAVAPASTSTGASPPSPRSMKAERGPPERSSAVSGTARWVPSGASITTSANMPGLSASDGLASSRRAASVRVLSSTIGATNVTCASSGPTPGNDTLAGWPT